jgi:MoaA/NifB/PqqE/SkfB family radical SAM enzyme
MTSSSTNQYKRQRGRTIYWEYICVAFTPHYSSGVTDTVGNSDAKSCVEIWQKQKLVSETWLFKQWLFVWWCSSVHGYGYGGGCSNLIHKPVGVFG